MMTHMKTLVVSSAEREKHPKSKSPLSSGNGEDLGFSAILAQNVQSPLTQQTTHSADKKSFETSMNHPTRYFGRNIDSLSVRTEVSDKTPKPAKMNSASAIQVESLSGKQQNVAPLEAQSHVSRAFPLKENVVTQATTRQQNTAQSQVTVQAKQAHDLPNPSTVESTVSKHRTDTRVMPSLDEFNVSKAVVTQAAKRQQDTTPSLATPQGKQIDILPVPPSVVTTARHAVTASVAPRTGMNTLLNDAVQMGNTEVSSQVEYSLDGLSSSGHSLPMMHRGRGVTGQGDENGNQQSVPLKHHQLSISSQPDGSVAPGAVSLSTNSGHSGNDGPSLDIRQPQAAATLSQIIQGQTTQPISELRVHVHPEGMGDILISVSKDQAGLHLHVDASQLGALQWLQDSKQAILDGLQSAGVDVSSLQLGFGQPGAFQQSFSNQSHQNQQTSQTLEHQEPGVQRDGRPEPSQTVSGIRQSDWRARNISVQA